MPSPAEPGPRYLVVNRFDDECGLYHEFAEGVDCRLAYITLAAGVGILDQDSAVETVVVESLDFATVLAEARKLIERHGRFDGIVGMSERDVLMTAQLREALGVSGWRAEFVRRFRDKLTMKRLVGGAGLRVPRFLSLDRDLDASRIVAELGLPLVLKPRSEGASRGVRILTDESDLRAALASIDPAAYECEEYVAGTIVHVDGVRRDAASHFVSASEYVNTCLDFARGQWLGSVIIDPGPLRDRIFTFSALCLDALGLVDGPFHLELIVSDAAEPTFLEVGIRPGGGEVPFIHRDLFGVSLFGEGFRTTLGLPPIGRPEEFAEPVGGGFVLFPEPRPWPSRVVSRNSLVGLVPGVYAEIIPDPGTVFDGTGGYDRIGGRFRLRGADAKAVRQTMDEVVRRYGLVAEPLSLVAPRQYARGSRA